MVEFTPIPHAPYKYDYQDVFRTVAAGKLDPVSTYREFCLKDLFFVLLFGLEREDINKSVFLVKCVREVEDDHEDTLDLWAREHYKSTILTYGLPIQELIQNPEERIGIFSHTRPIAKGFLRQIKITLEGSPPIKKWFPDVFYHNPKKEAPKWSEDDGLIIKRKSRPKESSVEAWGLVDGQPTSKHFTKRIYDDVVTKEGVTTPEQIKKVLDAYELSQSLGTDGGKKRMNGTHYHFADLYAHERKKKEGTTKVRIKPATDDGTPAGKPVLLSPERLKELREEQGPYIYSCQQLLKPIATEDQKFRPEWLKYYDTRPGVLNKYLLGDPANEKQKQSDYTVYAVIGLGIGRAYYLLDLLRDKLNLKERWAAFRDMWQRHEGILNVGYEKYGKDADITYFEQKQQEEGVYFHILPLGGRTSKNDRILRLVPHFDEGRFFLPHRLFYKGRDMVKEFIDEEYNFFPFCAHEDILDCISRIDDPQFPVVFPESGMTEQMAQELYEQYGPQNAMQA